MAISHIENLSESCRENELLYSVEKQLSNHLFEEFSILKGKWNVKVFAQ
jgi:hypothetical protein